MRNLKFRAWDKKNQIYMDWNMINQTAFNRGDYQLLYDCFHNPDIILEQFTSLHDKHGKEIYEGDIVEVKSKSYGKYLKAIIYKEEKAGFIVSGLPLPKGDGIQLEMPEREWEMEHMPCNCDGAMYEGYSVLHNKFDMEKKKNVADVVVRGNIHENQDLLNNSEDLS